MKTTDNILQEITETSGEDYSNNIKMIATALAKKAMLEYAKQMLYEIENRCATTIHGEINCVTVETIEEIINDMK